MITMALNIRNEKLERLAEELAELTGESRTAAILRALEERKERVLMKQTQKRTLPEVLDFLEKEVWAHIPRERLGRPLSRKERERILGYGRGGV
jgi:antitoxin VapB